jgi:hypothetical protein
MKLKNILLISALLVLLATACKKEGGFDHRSRYITESLEGKSFTVYRIIHTNYTVDLNPVVYAGSRIIMSFIGGNTSTDFLPGDTSLRFVYLSDWYRRLCQLGDTQHFFLGFSADHNLKMWTSTLNPPEIVLTRIVNTKQTYESIPAVTLDGEYEVIKGYVDGNPGFILKKYETYNSRKKGKGLVLMTIELITR